MAAVVEPLVIAPTAEDRLFPSREQLAQQLSFIAGSRYCADRPMNVLVSAGTSAGVQRRAFRAALATQLQQEEHPMKIKTKIQAGPVSRGCA